jgi:outer membrane protein insertion porin family
MLLQRPIKFPLLFACIIGIVAVMQGCLTPKKYQPNKPFIYKTNINIQGNLSTDEKLTLQERLQTQLDDSLKTKEKTIIPLVKQLRNPPVFDSMYASRSKEFMSSALFLLGYYKATVSWDSSLTRAKKDQQRITVNFTVVPGKSYKFDSIAYQFQDSALQRIVLQNKSPFLKKGDPYSADIITAELDRLLNIFRNEGYYRITKEDIEAERDTVFAALLNPLLDPFERLELIQQAQLRQQKPTMNVLFKLRNGANVKHLRKYTIKNVFIYPDLDLITADSSKPVFDTVLLSGIKILNQYNKFRPTFIASKNLLRPGELYQLTNYIRTYANFSQLGAWAQVSIDFIESKDSSATVDAIIKMYPTKKQDINVTFDGSYNTGNVFTTGASNLFGTGINFGLNNRNIAKQAIQSSTNLRGGIELGLKDNLVQTIQTSLSHTISFPKLIIPSFLFPAKKVDSLRFYRTQLNFSASYTDRRDFFLLSSLNVAWGYEWGKRNHSWYYSPFNVEFVNLTKRKKLKDLLDSIPNLQFSFNTGLVVSQVLSYTYQKNNGNKRNIFRMGLEESGLIFGSFKNLDRDANLFRYVKLDADYRHYINYKKTALVFRLYGGLGIPYGKQEDGIKENQLPFYKSFYAGGPYSLRAWQIRQLGVGSSNFYDTANGGGNDRFGNFQLEGNMEYRFDLGTFWGFKFKSALFTDIGNIWYTNDLGKPDKFKEAKFNPGNLYRDLAVAAGTSLRVSITYFVIRLDWAYKIKDPRYSYINNGWLHDIQLLKGQLQLGVNYPF